MLTVALKRVKNVHRSGGAREIEHPPGRWVTVEHDRTVDLPSSLAESLAEQDGWEIVDVKAATAKEDS